MPRACWRRAGFVVLTIVAPPRFRRWLRVGLSRRGAGSLEYLPPWCYNRTMPDDLYDRDALAWSERQAALLRRVARGERVTNVDWDHVVEEIEDVGRSELNTVHSYLRQMLAHRLQFHGWPDSDAVQHWRNEVATF